MKNPIKMLYFLRHAIAVERGTSEVTEFERPLTPEGRQKMQKAALGMGKLKIPLEALLSSPLTRAHQTAEVVQKLWNLKIEINEELSPMGSLEKLLATFKIRPEKHLMLVGHEPNLSQWMEELLGVSFQGSLEMKKGSLACLECDLSEKIPQSQLKYLLSPKILRSLA